MEEEDESRNCPDCQYLQQQQIRVSHYHKKVNENQQQQQSQTQSTSSSSYNNNNNNRLGFSTRNNDYQELCNIFPSASSSSSQNTQNQSLQIQETSSFNNANKTLNHDNLCYPNPNHNQHQQETLTNININNLGFDHVQNSTLITNDQIHQTLTPTSTISTSVAVEQCDLSSYCPTCAVLDLPDKYYRPPPPPPAPVYHFYGHPHPQVACFSPIPPSGPSSDCSWSTPGPPGTQNDFAIATSSFPPPPYQYQHQQNVNSSSSSNQQQNLNFSPSSEYFQQPSIGIVTFQNQNSLNSKFENSCSGSEPNFSTVIPVPLKVQNTNTKEIVDDIILLSSSSESEEEEDSDSESIECDSDSAESFSSSQVIVDENECLKVEEQKCVICLASISMVSEYSSLQFANILEQLPVPEETNLLSAEDLDISVSSGDIEIGGIEDEVGDFPTKKSLKNIGKVGLTLARLSSLVGIPLNVLQLQQQRNTFEEELEDIANLCTNCSKLAAIVDNLEKQLENSASLLKALIHPSYNNTNTTRNSEEEEEDQQIKKISSEINLIGEFIKENTQNTVTATVKDLKTLKTVEADAQTEITTKDSETETMTILLSFTKDFATQTAFLLDSEPFSFENQNNKSSEDGFTIEPIEYEEKEKEEDSEFSEKNKNTQKEYLCNFCGQILINLRSFKFHLQRHNEELQFICEFCNKSFPHRGSLNVHLKTHSNEKPFVCEISEFCKKSFSTNSNRKSHQIRCNGNGKNFSKFLSVEKDQPQILEDKSNNENNFTFLICPKCKLKFRSKDRFEKHTAKNCEKLLYDCKEEGCLKKFAKNSEFLAHQRLHQGIRFNCEICRLSVTTRGNQQAHLRTHSKIKRFGCKKCDKKYDRKSALEAHINRHEGIRAFKCNFCEKSFFDQGNLANHKKIHSQISQKSTAAVF